MNMFYAFRHRQFTLIWGGQTISRLGDSFYRIALAWWVLEATGSASAMGTVLILTTMPLIFFLLIGGATIDRFSRLQVMVLADIWRGIIVMTIAILAWINRLEIWHIYFASILLGMITAFFRPAYRTIVPELVPPHALLSANSLIDLGGQIAGTAGPILGALIVAQRNIGEAFLFDGVTFLIAAACQFPLLNLQIAQHSISNRNNILSDICEGFRAVISAPWLWITIAMTSLVNLTGRGPMNVSLPFLVIESLNADVGMLGWLYSLFAAGSVVGAVWMARKANIHRRGLVIFSMYSIAGLMTWVIGISIQFGQVVIAIIILGVALTIANLTWTYTLQQLIPKHLFGRVTSINSLSVELVLPLSFGLAGWVTDQYSASFTFIVGGILTAVVAAASMLHPAIRELE